MNEDDLHKKMRKLTERVGVLEDLEEIRALRRRFHQYVNDNRWTELGPLFTSEAYLDYAHLGQMSGRKNISSFFGSMPQALEKDVDATTALVKQFVHAHDVEINDNEATGISYLEAKTSYRNESFVVAGKFTDSYKRQTGRWLFSAVKLEVFWMVPAHQGWARGDRIQLTI